MMNNVNALTNKGWTEVQLREVVKLQKSWNFEGQEYKAVAYFGKLCNCNENPVVVMNVYENENITEIIIDDNCDVWKNIFAVTDKEEGNEFFKYLKKHGFVRVDM